MTEIVVGIVERPPEKSIGGVRGKDDLRTSLKSDVIDGSCCVAGVCDFLVSQEGR